MERPKLEILTGTDGVAELYIGGRYIADANCTPLEVGKRVAAALGADVVDLDADEPTPQPWRYLVTFAVLRTGWRAKLSGAGQIHASRWFDLDKDVEGPDDTQALAAAIAEGFPFPVIVTITGITYVDGPC